ncbi:MAG: hypothetical protein R2863_10210 [Candidatus Kapaibacterium sp.]|jgi:hypothetical protein|nr:hypothetical protein [Ignavibacteriota bacterium]
MYQFEKLKGETIPAYEAFIDYREGKCNPGAESARRQKQIEDWMRKWGWEERRDQYEEYIDVVAKKKKINTKSGQDELQGLLIELRRMLAAKIKESKREVESLSADNLVKLVSLSCRAIMDIAKAERDLDMDKLEHHSWGELADIIRNDPDAFKLAQQLSGMVYG